MNPHIDWAAGTLRFSEMETIQAIVSKRSADVKHLSGKQMSRLLKNKPKEKQNKKINFQLPIRTTYVPTSAL